MKTAIDNVKLTARLSDPALAWTCFFPEDTVSTQLAWAVLGRVFGCDTV